MKMCTEIQKKTANAIVNIFEAGTPHGIYSKVTVLEGDTGHLTYGRCQTTLGSGNLALLIHDYCESEGEFSEALKPYLSDLDRRDTKLDGDEKLKSLLRQAGDDPIMQNIQDAFFERVYWMPSHTTAERMGISKSLCVTVVYDSHIHGSFGKVRDIIYQKHGSVEKIGEEKWIGAYVSERRNWLANHAQPNLRRTVYRMDAFKNLINGGRWDLPLPLSVRGVVITAELFSTGYQKPVLVSANDADVRVLFLTRKRMEGDDVKVLQRALGFAENAVDGIFGPDTDRAVKAFQKKNCLKVDGKVGPATRSSLGIVL